jgi:hypothetical protein
VDPGIAWRTIRRQRFGACARDPTLQVDGGCFHLLATVGGHHGVYIVDGTRLTHAH